MPVGGGFSYSGGLGQGPGLGELAQLLMRGLSRGGGGGQPRDYLGPDVSGAQDLIKALQPPPPERMPMAPGVPVPMSKPPMGPAMGPQMAGYQGGGPVVGPGDGRSDSVPAMVEGQGMAQLSNDEYVIPADVVSALGRGSSAAGAKKLDATVQQVRAGYASKLKGLPQPKVSRGKKGFGGLLGGEEDVPEAKVPEYLRGIAGSVEGSFKNWQKQRPSGVSEVAPFNPDQMAYFARSRGAAADETGTMAALQRGQDMLGGIYDSTDPWNDRLIEQSMADYDRGTMIDSAARRRSAAGRGAFGEGTQLAEVEAGREAARGRGMLGSQLREMGLTRRTQAAQQIGDLAERERAANVGNISMLGGIGEIERNRAQQIASAPYDRLQRTNSLVAGSAVAPPAGGGGDNPMKMILGLGAVAAGTYLGGPVGGAAAGSATNAMMAKGGGRIRAGGRASRRKRGQPDRFYADGGKVGPGAFKRIPVSKPDLQEQVELQLGLSNPKYERPIDQMDLSQVMPANMSERPPPPPRDPKMPPKTGRSYGERLSGARLSQNIEDVRPQTTALREQATTLYSQALDKLIAQGMGLQDADRILMTALHGIDPNDYAAKNARLGEVLQDPRGYAGGQGFADGGQVSSSSAWDWAQGLGKGERALAEWLKSRSPIAPEGTPPEPNPLRDWWNRYVMSGNDPAWMKEMRGDPGRLPPPSERESAGKDPADRAKEVLQTLAPAAPAPAPAATPAVAKPARTPKRSTTTTPTAAAPAPGIGTLPERLQSPEEPPITVAPPSGIRTTELPPPPPAGIPEEPDTGGAAGFIERAGVHPLTQFGLGLMISKNKNLLGAAAEAGIGAIGGMAAGRKEAREQARLDVAEKRAAIADKRAENTDVLALMRLGLDEKNAKNLAADRAENRRLEQARLDETTRHDRLRESQYQEGLGIRRQNANRLSAGGARDPNRKMRDLLTIDLHNLMPTDGSPPSPEEAAAMAKIQKQIDALGPVSADPPTPEGAFVDDDEEP